MMNTKRFDDNTFAIRYDDIMTAHPAQDTGVMPWHRIDFRNHRRIHHSVV